MKNFTKNLFIVTAFLLLGARAMAQDGQNPFVGSTHNYTVSAANDLTNTLLWEVTTGVAADYTINSGASSEVVNITWNNAGTYTLQFTETDATTNCATVKTMSITVTGNSFDVSTTSPVATCNAAEGQINYSGSTAATPVTFTIEMNTAVSSFNPNWEIQFTLTPGTGASISSVSAASGTLSGTGTYTLTGLTSTLGNGSVNITMDVTGDINTELDVVLAITSAKELTYNTPDVDTDDWSATQYVNAIPATTNITTD